MSPRKPPAARAAGTAASPHAPRPRDHALFLDRELSLLAFFRRVLEEAEDPSNPLLERVKFLSIVGSNTAEFFMVRVAGLKQQIDAGIAEPTPAGWTPVEQLREVRKAVRGIMDRSRACLRALLPDLQRAGIRILAYRDLDRDQREAVGKLFRETVFPVLTPLAVDPGRPFPHISNMSLNLAVVIGDPDGTQRFARVKLPAALPRLVPVTPEDGETNTFVWLEQVAAAHLGSLFPGKKVLQSYPFRVTRDAEVMIQEMEAEDLLETVERGIRQRRFGRVVRVTVDAGMPASVRALLAEYLSVDPEDLYQLESPLGISDLMALHGLDRPELKDTPFQPALPLLSEAWSGRPFEAIRQRDILLHHPFDSFQPVLDFVKAAAVDPAVLAIKQTLYRVGQRSPIVEALLEAAANGKQVAVLVELKARFDEESNIEWARALEREGVHVVYGLLGLKTHSKITLVVRREGGGIRRYLHLSTGNYNPSTAKSYTDLGLFTADEDLGADASDLFNFLTGYSEKRDYREFLVAPIGLRSGLEALIRREMDHHAADGQGRMILKMNSLVDTHMIRLLYEASQAGVRIDILVRGMCCLKPGLAGVSENIRVTSIVGRFLEHSRIYWFRGGGKEQVYLGSADMMMRNLDRRVEILFPIKDPSIVRTLRDEILETYLADNVKARLMTADGSYPRRERAAQEAAIDAQSEFLRRRAAPPPSRQVGD